MSSKQPGVKTKTAKPPFSAGEKILLVLCVLFLLCGAAVFGWYGSTYIPVRQTSEIRAKEVDVRAGGVQCTLDIPAGTLTLRHPSRAAVGSKYSADAEVSLERPLRLINCNGGMPKWNINLEAQTTFVASEVLPFAAIRQPASGRDAFAFQWTFTPLEQVPQYQSHLWLRAIVTEQDQTIENWNILVRDFPMENAALFGQITLIWIIAGGFALVLGILLLILLLQKRHRDREG